jgi:NAD(P)-dependent dehydrogenase (short-subunit alcohol dehydrogenase family)
MKEILLILRGLLAEKFTIEYDVFYNLPLLKMDPGNMEKHGRSGSSELPVWNPVLNKSLSGEKLRENLGEQLDTYVKEKGKKPGLIQLEGQGPILVETIEKNEKNLLENKVAVITGAAGAIGHGICHKLLAEGCCVAATDINPEGLNRLVNGFKKEFGNQIAGFEMDVSDEASVGSCFERIVHHRGGFDILIINAGIAHVSSLNEMDLKEFQKLERVNIDGALLSLSEAGRCLSLQGTGGDIVMVSTKNVFAPGATFGAYSATKAASHQLARIASLELAPQDIRVNMVAPDAVFSSGDFRSGLWAKVGPGRMKARGLDEAGLEEYYRNRNLLKSKVTARHVANAVMFFITRQTPSTGATLPVDGGLPDATPR